MSGVNPAVTGAWLESYDPGDRQFLKIGDLQLESGESAEALPLPVVSGV